MDSLKIGIEDIYRGSQIHPSSEMVLFDSIHNYQRQLTIHLATAAPWFHARPHVRSENSIAYTIFSPLSSAVLLPP